MTQKLIELIAYKNICPHKIQNIAKSIMDQQPSRKPTPWQNKTMTIIPNPPIEKKQQALHSRCAQTTKF